MSRTCIAVWLENHRRELRRYASLDPRFARDIGFTSDALAVVCAAPAWGACYAPAILIGVGSRCPVSKTCLVRSDNQ
jgi:hypothetical protein